MLININPCLFKNRCNWWAVLTFLITLVLLPSEALNYIPIAVKLVTAFDVKAVGQQIDKLSKYPWHLDFFPR